MADSGNLQWQRRFGGVLGVVLLAFALAYRFFPDLLHVQRSEHAASSYPLQVPGQPMGFDQRPGVQTYDPADAGPPISLAPSPVILARQQAANEGEDTRSPASEQVTTWLNLADQALAAGKLVGEQDSALSLYRQAFAVEPDNRAVLAGLAQVARQLTASAQQALDEGDSVEAEDTLVHLRSVPNAEAEVARLEHQLKVLDQVTPMLARAADLLKQDKALERGDGSALAIYREVLTLDVDNSVATQGLQQIQQVVLDQALAAVARNDYSGIDAAVDRAADILPGSQALQDTRSRIERIRRQQAENLLAQARSALDGGNRDLAQKLAAQALAISPDLPGIDAFNTELRNARLYANYRPGQVFRDRFLDRAGSAPGMVVIPTGRFMMGSAEDSKDHQASESPQHLVTIENGFALGRSEITVGQFREFINASGYVTDAERLGSASVYDDDSGRMHDERGADWEHAYNGRKAERNAPVVSISWNDAKAYVEWLSQRTGKAYRLPSEAEFEYALRAGTASPYWWGTGAPTSKVENVTGAQDRLPSGRRWANSFRGYADGYWGPAPVMSFAANAFGLFDMGGNVSEWTQDCWHDNYVRAPGDGRAWVNPGCSARVIRGGSWGSSPAQVRSAYRLGAAADTRSGRVGFRVLRVL